MLPSETSDVLQDLNKAKSHLRDPKLQQNMLGFMQKVAAFKQTHNKPLLVKDVLEFAAKLSLPADVITSAIKRHVAGSRISPKVKKAVDLIRRSGRIQDALDEITTNVLGEDISAIKERFVNRVNDDAALNSNEEIGTAVDLYVMNWNYIGKSSKDIMEYWFKAASTLQRGYGKSVHAVFARELRDALRHMKEDFIKDMKASKDKTAKESIVSAWNNIRAAYQQFAETYLKEQLDKTLYVEHIKTMPKSMDFVASNSRGIKHLEALPVNEFIDTLRNIDEYDVTEKMDGSNIIFGLKKNKLYTMRKGEDAVFNEADYSPRFSSNFKRVAHAALASRIDTLKEFGSDFEIEAEVLYESVPNAINYGGENTIVFLFNRGAEEVNLVDLAEALRDGAEFESTVVETEDGISMSDMQKNYSFGFAAVPKMPGNTISKSKSWERIQSVLETLDAALQSPSEIEGLNLYEVASLNLNKLPEGVDKQAAKAARSELHEKLYGEEGIQRQIKAELVKEYVHKLSSNFGPSIKDGGWIEGVVLSHPSGKTVKLVDQNMFNSIKDFLWEVRTEVSGQPKNKERGRSITGEMLFKMAESLGYPELAQRGVVKRLQKIGESETKVIKTLLADKNTESIRQEWKTFVECALRDLDKRLTEYNETKSTLEYVHETANTKRRFTYEGQIDKRTLQVFAESRKFLNDMAEYIDKAKTDKQLIKAFIGSALERAFPA